MQSASERDSILRWSPGSPRGHVESTFLKLNLVSRRQALWLKFTVLEPPPGHGDAQAAVWAIFFDVDHPERRRAVKRVMPASDISWQADRFLLRFGDCEMARGRSHGSVSGAGSIAWDLTWTTGEESFRHFPHDRMYELPLPRSKALSPTIDARFQGTVTVDGERIEVVEAPGMHGHNWGENHAREWVWAHCNAFAEDGVVFEGLSARVALGPITTPALTILHLRTPVETVTFNRLRDLVASASRQHGLYWSFEATGGPWRLRGVVHGSPDRFVGVDYHDPDGTVHHCLNSKVAVAELTLLRRHGATWSPYGQWRSDDSCALEIGTCGDTHGVPILLP
ncbi:MAG: hypothetical protein AMXMBFR64_29840 [Myxococcales bacterium]